MSDGERGYKEVRGLARGLKVIIALNANARTQVGISTIVQATKLHRTTVKRLLETLRKEGYVDYDEVSGGYSLRLPIKQLSVGYVDEEWMAEVARPTMNYLATQSIWPSSLVTYDIDAMLIRETTHFRTPVTLDKMMVGMRIPILLTAAGRAFLFACTAERRKQIITLLANKTDEEGFLARDPHKLKELQRQTEEAGCAFMVKAWSANSERSAIAVPVLRDGTAIGAINMLFHVRAMSIAEAIKQNLTILKTAAAEIAAGIREKT